MTPEFASKISVEVDRLCHFARVTRRKVMKQQKFNSAVVLYAVTATASIVVLSKAVSECKKRIEAMEKKMGGEPITSQGEEKSIDEENSKEG